MPEKQQNLPAKVVELFTINDDGSVNLMAVCPVCRQAYFYCWLVEDSAMLVAKCFDGTPMDPSPMSLVCDKCDSYARGLMDGAYLDTLYRHGHINAAYLLIGALAGPDRIVPDHKLMGTIEVWELLSEAVDRDNTYVWCEGEFDEIWKILNGISKGGN